MREIKEETGIFAEVRHMHKELTLAVRHAYADFFIHAFRFVLDEPPQIILEEDAHTDFCFRTPEQAIAELDLVQDNDQFISHFYHIT